MDVAFASRPGAAGRPNEDFVIAAPHAAVVLDGVTVPGELGTGCAHGTAWYVRRLAAALMRQLDQDERPLVEALRGAIAAVRELHGGGCALDHPGTPSAAVAILRERGDHLDALALADAYVLIDAPGELTVVTDLRIEQAAPPEKLAMAGYRIGTPEHAGALAELVELQRQQRNRPGGFWLAAANPDAAEHAVSTTLARHGVRRAALLTDGATRPVDQYDQLTWPGLLDKLDELGPAGLLDYVHDLDASDPAGTRWPRPKLHDDATAALCHWV